MKRILITLACTAVVLTGCIQDEVLDSGRTSGTDAVEFGTYLGRSAATRATVVTSETLESEGFGVMAWYTGQDEYSEGYSSDVYDYDFMVNTCVSHDGSMWSYTPLKYWPNNEGDKLTFLAYAPYSDDYSVLSGGAATAISQTIDFTVKNEVTDQIDLLWSDNPENEDMLKPYVDYKVLFTFKHALSRIGFNVAAFIDDVRTNEGSVSQELDANTVINVKKVMLVNGTTDYAADNTVTPEGVFYTGGTLDLYNFTAAEADETVPAAWDVKLPDDASEGQYFTLTADRHFTNTTTDTAGEPVFQLAGTDATILQPLNADDSYIMIIPQDFTTEYPDGYKVYVEYDVVTTGTNVQGEEDNSTVTNCILSDVALTTDFESGKAYTLNIYLGMTSVKFDVVVKDWIDGDPADTDEYLPENMGAQVNEDGFEGDGTSENPYKIRTVEQFVKMVELINLSNAAYTHASYLQMNDLDLTGSEIGSSVSLNEFYGTYDGGGYAMDNLKLETCYSIFGQNYGTVKDVHLTNASAKLQFYGVLVSHNEGTGVMISCSYDGVLEASSSQYSGPLASGNDGIMIGCWANVTLSSQYIYSGALIGYNQGTIIGCYSSGEIIGSSTEYQAIAGIASYSNVENACVYGCYTTAEFSVSSESSIAYPICNITDGASDANYYSSEFAPGFSDDGSEKIDELAVTWESAVAEMNTAIQNAEYDYQYVENTDEATKDAFPYVLVAL